MQAVEVNNLHRHKALDDRTRGIIISKMRDENLRISDVAHHLGLAYTTVRSVWLRFEETTMIDALPRGGKKLKIYVHIIIKKTAYLKYLQTSHTIFEKFG